MQANSILVAGHDTTSFMLTSTLYWVARSPQVKARVFEEIECFGRSRQVTHDDMDKFPYLEVRGVGRHEEAGRSVVQNRVTRVLVIEVGGN
jgi:cytochrome P450